MARARLLAWYEQHARPMPWRVTPEGLRRGQRPDPYRVWLSEVMLQQTTVAHASAYFLAFTQRWPTVEALAAAADAEVMGAWAGLGYYARARNLLACARAVVHDHNSRFPTGEAGLLALPGIGPYTAAAIAAIAFDQPTNVVDGNVERVIARMHAVKAQLPGAKPKLRALAGAFADGRRPGDWAQAMMDLGATICRPRTPRCGVCPLTDACAARATGRPEDYPLRAAKAPRPQRHGLAWVLEHRDLIGLVRRPSKGLLGAMLALPASEFGPYMLTDTDVIAQAPAARDWREVGTVEHVFTHFSLKLRVLHARSTDGAEALVWTPKAELGCLPSVFLKAARLAIRPSAAHASEGRTRR